MSDERERAIRLVETQIADFDNPDRDQGLTYRELAEKIVDAVTDLSSPSQEASA